jgi:mono/diheme cytochrome c family protein
MRIALRVGLSQLCFILGALLIASLLSGCGASASSVGQPVSKATQTTLVERGRYLARAADCAACHTAKDGAPFAGGFELDSPYGKLYGSNITPDKQYGIGNWSADDFYQAMHEGVAPGWRHLYPAMPYASYRLMPRADVDAIYAYLMQLKPYAVPNKEPALRFPYNMRLSLILWNALFLEDEMPAASSGSSADWQRGGYLVNSLGHCAECHTPRGTLGQLKFGQQYLGGALGRIAAPDISAKGLAERGWNPADLRAFLASGIAPQGSAFSEMHPVVHLSTQYLSQDDLSAMSTYLLGDRPPAPAPLKLAAAAQTDNNPELKAGQRLYLNLCAGCHGQWGDGKPHVAVAMKGNSTVRQRDPHNLIVAVLDGIEEEKFPGLDNMQAMPGFAAKLSDQELAQLSNFLRAAWGGQPADVSADTVKALRVTAGQQR